MDDMTLLRQDVDFGLLSEVADAFSHPAVVGTANDIHLASVELHKPRIVISSMDPAPRFPTIEESDEDSSFDLYIFYHHFQQLDEIATLQFIPDPHPHTPTRLDVHGHRPRLNTSERSTWVDADVHKVFHEAATESPLGKLVRICSEQLRASPTFTEYEFELPERETTPRPRVPQPFSPPDPLTEPPPLYKAISSPDLSHRSSPTTKRVSSNDSSDYRSSLPSRKLPLIQQHPGRRFKLMRKFVRRVLTHDGEKHVRHHSSSTGSTWSGSTQSLDDWTTVSIPSNLYLPETLS